jgi:glutathione synthase/RimK-type ligase-like ATP-grasp enzyme
MMQPVRYQLKSIACSLPLRAVDRVRNLRLDRDTKRLLIVGHTGKRAYTYRDFLSWVDRDLPELRTRMKFCRLPGPTDDWSSIGAMTFWIADSIDVWSPSGHRQADELERRAAARGLVCLNSITTLGMTTKSESTRLWNEAGLRAPRCIRVRHAADVETLNDFRYPLLIRDDRGHGRPSVLVHEPSELTRVDWRKLVSPMVAEYVDTRSPKDGLYRKYRCIVAGNRVVPRHLLANEGWEVRPDKRIASEELLREELTFVERAAPHESQLVYAARVLGLDIAGIDYSLTAEGDLILWEANPVPNLNAPPSDRAGHLMPAVIRSFAAIAELYLGQLGVEVPALLTILLQNTSTRKVA